MTLLSLYFQVNGFILGILGTNNGIILYRGDLAALQVDEFK